MASEKNQLTGLWSSTERTCIYLLQYTTTTKVRLLQIHAFILRNSFYKNKNILSKFLATCSSIAAKPFATSSEDATDLIRYARKLFDHMPDGNDTYISNTMMRAHLGIHQYDECLSLYRKLKRNDNFKPDDYTFLTLAKLCTSTLDVWTSQQVHNHVFKQGFGHNLFVATSLLDTYAKLRQMNFAQKLFDEMPERSQVSWTALVSGYANIGQIDNARMYFNQMPNKDTPAFNAMIDAYVKIGDMTNACTLFNNMSEKNVVSYTSMVDGFCNHGDVDKARSLFNTMPQKNLVSWNAMIKGYYQNKQPNQALKLFQELQFEPDNVTILSILPVIADLGALDLGKWVHEFIIRKKMNTSTNISTSLIDMYAKCGEFTKAREVFGSLTIKETATWNALIHGLAVNGNGKEALNVFLDMNKNGIKPNEITMTSVLSACNHSGLVHQGIKWFNRMKEFGISKKIEHYGCMIDLLGRSGCLEEAEKIMDEMPFEVNEIILSSFLSSCCYVRDFERVERFLRKNYGKEFWNVGNYVTLRNLYASEKRWVDVEEVKEIMRSKKSRKEVGCSVIEVGGEVWGFSSGDMLHHEWVSISLMLEMLLVDMKKVYLTNVEM